VSPEVRATIGAFDVSRAAVEEAKAALVATVRTGRVEGIPLAEGVAGFELLLRDAAAGMPAWRSAETETDWVACDAGVAESLRRAERLRLEGSPRVYEELIAEVDELLEPLDAFAGAATRIRALGRGH
jgi:hypothetical protein